MNDSVEKQKRGITEWRFKRVENVNHLENLNTILDFTLEVRPKNPIFRDNPFRYKVKLVILLNIC